MASKKPTVETILQREDALKPEHEMNRPVWQDIDDLITLNQYGFTREVQPGEEQDERYFDSTAPESNDALSSFMGGNLISRAFIWENLRFRNEGLNKDEEATGWLERQNLRMIRSFNQSNFYSEGHQVLRDASGLGTAAMFVPERENDGSGWPGFLFEALPLSGILIDQNADQFVDTLFRSYKISLRAYIRKWGEENLGPKAKQAVRNNKLDMMLDCLHAVFPRDKEFVADENPVDTAMPWASYYVDRGDKVILRESGFMEFPFLVPRWDKTSGKRYGRGRGHVAIGHVRSLNMAVQMGFKAEAKAIDPPTKGTPGNIRGGLNTAPGAHTTVDRMDGLDGLYPSGMLRTAVDSKRLSVSDYRAEVRGMFYSNLLQLPPGNVMTAYEFAKRLEMTQRVLGPTLGRIEQEFLTPLIRRCFNMMMRGGGFEQPPPVVLAHEDSSIDVEYQGPLAKNQRLGEIEGLERLIAIGMSLYQFYPPVFDNLDADKSFRNSAEILGVSKDNMANARQIAKERIERQAQAQQAAQADALRQDAVAAGKLGPLVGAVGAANGGG